MGCKVKRIPILQLHRIVDTDRIKIEAKVQPTLHANHAVDCNNDSAENRRYICLDIC